MIAITSLPLTAVSEGFQYVYQDWEFAKCTFFRTDLL